MLLCFIIFIIPVSPEYMDIVICSCFISKTGC
jgi:hypothetical protein